MNDADASRPTDIASEPTMTLVETPVDTVIPGLPPRSTGGSAFGRPMS